MFKAARLDKIKQILLEQKQIDIARLSNLLGVSDVTARNDLEILEHEGFVIRTHGGVSLNEANPPILPFSPSLNIAKENIDEDMIADTAVQMIKENDVVFVGPGTICALIASKLDPDKNITIVTNNLIVANVLAVRPNITLILVGGTLDCQNKTLVGDLVARCLENILINKAFISVNGVDMKHGYSVSNINDLKVYEIVSQISSELIIVASKSKFDKTSLMRFAPLTLAKRVVTSEDIPGEYKTYFFNNGVQIFTSYELTEM